MDTLRHTLSVDVIYGYTEYYSGCESAPQRMVFGEIHAGTADKFSEHVTGRLDAGVIPAYVKPNGP